MNDLLNNLMFFIGVAGTVGALTWLVASQFWTTEDKKISDRLTNRGSGVDTRRVNVTGSKKQGLMGRMSTIASSPFMSDKQERISALRKRLAMAGIYDPGAIRSFIGFRFLLLFVGVIGGYILGTTMLKSPFLGLAMGGLLGYLSPKVWLSARVSQNQKSLNLGLPDALDLMVICVESGLTVDASLQRVGDELALAHPIVSREFAIAHTETRLGVSRQDAFRNLASRTGNLNLQALTAMLIQADKFGTGVGLALRVQAESIRIKRQYAAEEMAAKASVKMSFPLVMFIFPATFVVIGGPVAIDLFNTSGF
ncbi:MAG TPA: type II secretion system F family protein [Tepidisphaeraceae bacterium]|nr:type II secretion system F family protein [Tepidisphaeraceae bacterium]